MDLINETYMKGESFLYRSPFSMFFNFGKSLDILLSLCPGAACGLTPTEDGDAMLVWGAKTEELVIRDKSLVQMQIC